jgi:AbrB family looped-hinge helix DNA binding protein
METTRLSSKGQIILPKSIRDAHHWTPGTEFEVESRPEGVLLRPKKRFAPTHIAAVVGCTGYQGPPRSLEEMEEAIAQGVSERHARGRY